MTSRTCARFLGVGTRVRGPNPCLTASSLNCISSSLQGWGLTRVWEGTPGVSLALLPSLAPTLAL